MKAMMTEIDPQARGVPLAIPTRRLPLDGTSRVPKKKSLVLLSYGLFVHPPLLALFKKPEDLAYCTHHTVCASLGGFPLRIHPATESLVLRPSLKVLLPFPAPVPSRYPILTRALGDTITAPQER